MSNDLNSTPVSVVPAGEDHRASADLQPQYLTTPNSSEEIFAWLDAIAEDDRREARKARH